MVHRRDKKEPQIRKHGEHHLQISQREKEVTRFFIAAAVVVSIAVFILLYTKGG